METLQAQRAQQADAPVADSAPVERERLGLSVSGGVWQLAGQGELLGVFSDAFTPDVGRMRPRVLAVGASWRVLPRLRLVAEYARGEQRVEATTVVTASSASSPAAHTSTLELTSVAQAGVEVIAWHLGGGRRGAERLRLVLGAGAGVSTYALRQVGEFVDVARRVQFADDLASSGRGVTGYGVVGLELPLGRRVAVRGELRQQFGSAETSGDFRDFDRLELAGTRVALGVALFPFVSGARAR